MRGYSKPFGFITVWRLIPPAVLVILASLAFFALPTQAAFHAATISISPNVINVPVGGEVTVDIVLNGDLRSA